MKRILPVIASLIFASTAAHAKPIESGYVGCVTKDALDELITAASNQDTRQMKALIGSVCAPLGGYEYSIVDRGMLKSQIRVYVGDQSVLLWTVTEALK